MIPISLRVTNFRSYRGEQVFCFPERNGLYFMQGINEAEPRLEANGSGKSTLWDALTWCWYGKTSRGLKAGDVCNWDASKGTVVEFDFQLREDDPCVWTIRRTWGPISWTLSHIAEYITDEEVVDLAKEKDNPALSWLALSFEPWLNAVLTAQGQPMFLDLKRDAQAALFSDVMGLDRWLDYSARASKAASDQDKGIRDAERELSGLLGQIDELGKRDFRESLEDWESGRRKRIREASDTHDGLMDKRKGLKNALERAQERETAARQGLERAKPSEALTRDFHALQREAQELDGRLREKVGLYNDLHERLNLLEDDSACPTCGQRLDRDQRKQELRKHEERLRLLNEDVEKMRTERGILAGAAEAIEEKCKKEVRLTEELRNALDDAQRDASNARRAYDLNERELDRLEDEAERVAAEANPYADMEREQRERGRELRERADALERNLERMQSRHFLLSYWVRGFKEVRLSLIAEALTELEVEVNSCVDALGLVGWELEFRVDRETKGGGIQRGFDCFVRSPHNEKPVPWEAWSGGEGQRLRLAAQMGLADLIRSRTGAAIALEVWDEPMTGLSPQGKRDLLECLEARASREGRQVWIIDHEAHDYGGFAGSATITKTAKGSFIEQQ